MLVVTTNQTDFEYDIHSLVKAFYPAAEVRVFTADLPGASDFHAETTGAADNKYHERCTCAPNFHAETVSAAGDECHGQCACSPDFPDKSLRSTENLPTIRIAFTADRIFLRLIAPTASPTDPTGNDFPAAQAELRPAMDRIQVKNALKQLLYHSLSAYTGIRLPWGALTGIRPVKIPMTLLAQGMPPEEIRRHMEAVYLISEKKGRLALAIAEKEREILAGTDYQAGYSLYLGIPFCPTTCLYCSFTSYPIAAWRHRVEEYLTALEKEIDFTARTLGHRPLHSIYIGGGTPTTLSPAQLERLLAKISGSLDLSEVREFTVEAGRADSITAEKLAVLKRYGVDRISINPQTMKPETLKIIGRHHTVEQVREAFALARSLGFANINMDLILGLPEETAADVAATMAAVAELKPDGLTIHSLAVKRAARLSRWVTEHGMDALQNTEETMAIAMKGVAALGMAPYYLYRQKNMAGNFENIGYATPGHYGIYNILMMEEVQTVVALGAGTVSKRVYADGRITRRDNVKDVALYLDRIDEMIARKEELLKEE